ncbi:MAG: hemerythrin domain-containing protein [Muribaculaceae bacterium]|nr:hemerythrin domain-containing protein [Muribaculaceae bacterium]
MMHSFTTSDSVIDLVNADYNILPILSRFSIPLGFGNKTIGEVCSDSGINTDVFLLIVNFILSGRISDVNIEHVGEIADFLHKSHDYFLAYKFPHIRNNLLNALDRHHEDINPHIVRFFDDYVAQVMEHFEYEENTVFPYIHGLVEGKTTPGYNIESFRRHHDQVSEKLAELKNIILRYYTTSMPDLMYDVLVDIYTCQQDLDNHNEIENSILIPVTAALEKKAGKKRVK